MLSIPSLYFLLVPYSEALFFLLASCLVWGIVRRVRPIVWVALLVAGFTRATAMMLLPALIVTCFLSRPPRQWLSALREAVIHYIIPSLLGLGLFVVHQWAVTGVWFAYFKHQSTAWGHTFAKPTLPLDHPDGRRVLWINALATVVNTLLIGWLIMATYRWLRDRKPSTIPLAVLAAGYATGVSFTLTFFQPIWGTGHTNVYGTHRYSFCVPFIMIAVQQVADAPRMRAWIIRAVWVACNAVLLLYGSYQHIGTWMFYNVATIGPVLYAVNAWRRSWTVQLAIVLLGLCAQAWMFQYYLRGWYTD